MKQEYLDLKHTEVLIRAAELNKAGYRIVQICGIPAEGRTELLYSFDKDHDLLSYKVSVPFGETVASITPEYWAAFVYENEVHDLFGVEFTDSQLDYKGNFFRMSSVTPWKGPEAGKGAE